MRLLTNTKTFVIFLKKVKMAQAKYENGKLVILGRSGKLEVGEDGMVWKYYDGKASGNVAVEELGTAVYEFCKNLLKSAGEIRDKFSLERRDNLLLVYDGLTVYFEIGLMVVKMDALLMPDKRKIWVEFSFMAGKVEMKLSSGLNLTFYDYGGDFGKSLRNEIYDDKISLEATGKFVKSGDEVKLYINNEEVAKFGLDHYEANEDRFICAFMRQIDIADLLIYIYKIFQERFGEIEVAETSKQEYILKLGNFEYQVTKAGELKKIKYQKVLNITEQHVDIHFNDLVRGYTKHDGLIFKLIEENEKLKKLIKTLNF